MRFGQHGHLPLLERDADGPDGLGRLEVERAIAGLTDRAGHEAIGLAEDMNDTSHGTSDPTANDVFEQAGCRPRQT